MRFIKAVLVVFLMWSGSVHAGAWPTDNVVTTNLDSPTDSPSAARGDIYTALQRIKDIIGARNSASGVAPLDASSLVPLVNIPATLTGKDADSVDGIDFSTLTATVAELNYTDVTTPGTAQAFKALVTDTNKEIESLGNVGVGTTIYPWGSGQKAIDIGVGAEWTGGSNTSYVQMYNLYHDGTNFRYKTTGFASYITQNSSGETRIYTAPSGTAGAVATVTSRLAIANDGTTTINGNAVYHASGTDVAVADGGTGASTANGAKENLGIYHGRVNSAGTAIRLPSGWTSSRTATGAYTVTHNLGTTAYTPMISVTDVSGVIAVVAATSTTIQVLTSLRSTGADTDAPFAFSIVRD